MTSGVETLTSRREELTEWFYMHSAKIVVPDYLLQDKWDPAITDRPRYPKTFNSLLTSTEKFQKSFLLYCLNHYD